MTGLTKAVVCALMPFFVDIQFRDNYFALFHLFISPPGNNESSYTCIHANRAVSFDDHYTCLCLPGWEGVHCGVNVDECSSSPCGWPYVCWDGVDGYHCGCAADNPNCAGLEPWMTALIVVSVVMGTAASVIAWYIYMIRRG